MLTTAEMQNLTYWKWRYFLALQGFTAEESARLVFLKWYVACRHISD